MRRPDGHGSGLGGPLFGAGLQCVVEEGGSALAGVLEQRTSSRTPRDGADHQRSPCRPAGGLSHALCRRGLATLPVSCAAQRHGFCATVEMRAKVAADLRAIFDSRGRTPATSGREVPGSRSLAEFGRPMLAMD